MDGRLPYIGVGETKTEAILAACNMALATRERTV
jgi:hypothetical protein